jgi:hypothetical protein
MLSYLASRQMSSSDDEDEPPVQEHHGGTAHLPAVYTGRSVSIVDTTVIMPTAAELARDITTKEAAKEVARKAVKAAANKRSQVEQARKRKAAAENHEYVYTLAFEAVEAVEEATTAVAVSLVLGHAQAPAARFAPRPAICTLAAARARTGAVTHC